MNFFEAQDSARHTSSILIMLFGLAIVILLALSNFIVFELMYLADYGALTSSLSELDRVFDKNLSILISSGILLFICLGSVYKLVQLSSGGSAIAQQLGGVIVPRSSTTPLHKKILNVVEEMAIASGTPVPQVYLLNEPGINAFAAGWKTTNAVIGITQGALERLTREELQGIIAHEFSHIFNGDMRLNIRLIAILHGILMIGLLGQFLLRSSVLVQPSRNSKGSSAVLIIVGIGAALAVVGYSGTFFGNWIKSLISRQREYLADASAVQFTRSSQGIANALKKIGGAVSGSALSVATVDEYSHAYFANGEPLIRSFSFSTHPPLKERIFRIQPVWDGKYIIEKKRSAVEDRAVGLTDEDSYESRQKKRILAAKLGEGITAGVTLDEMMNTLESIGDVSQEKIDAAHIWHQQLPDVVLVNAENPYGAQALIFALLLHEDIEIQKKQFSVLTVVIGERDTRNVERVHHTVSGLTRAKTLPLIDLSLPTLREMSIGQYQRFRLCVQQLIKADNEIELREWIVQRVVLQHLDDEYGLRKKPLASYFILGSAKQACELVLSMLAYLEHTDDEEMQQAFDAAKHSIAASALQLLPEPDISIGDLDSAMDDLELLKPPIKKRFLQACVSCIAHDGNVTVPAYELIRAIASCLDSPMPPVLEN